MRDIIEHSGSTVKRQLEILVSGESIEQEIIPEMTYHDLDTEDNNGRIRYLWSLLYNTGYLTSVNTGTDRWKKLKIPNQEVEVIFEQQIFRWFEKVIKSNTERLKRFADAIKCGDAKTMEDCLNTFLRESISVRDSAARKGKKESFYHGILLGMLSGINEWIIRSNAETGNGYSDILVELPEEKTGCIFELKYAETGLLDTACDKALKQAENKNYTEKLKQDGMKTIHVYAIACRLKESRIKYKRY